MQKSNRIKNRKILRKITLENAKELGLYEIGSGTYGKCYLDETTGIIYKLFKVEPSEFSFTSPHALHRLKKLKFNKIAFPQNLIKKFFRIKGISYNYIDGKSLEEFILNKEELSAAEFIKYYSELLNVIPYLTKKHVRISDLNLGNIIINNQGFYIIDIDNWNVSKHFDHTINNIQEINSTMIEFITFCNFAFEDPNNIIKNEKEFKTLFNNIIYQMPLYLNLSEIINEIQKKIKEPYTYENLVSSLNNFVSSDFNVFITKLYNPDNNDIQVSKKHKH